MTLDWREIEAERGSSTGLVTASCWALRDEGIRPWSRSGARLHGPTEEQPRRPARSAATFARFARRSRAVPMGSPVDRVERAQPAALAAAPVAGPRHAALNPAAAAIKSVIPRASIAGGATARAAAQAGRPRSTSSGAWDTRRATRRVRAPPAPALACRDPVHRGLRSVHHDLDGDAGTAPQETRAAFGSRTRIWLTELGYQTNPPDRILGVSWARQARSVAEAQRRAYSASGVDLLIQYLVRDGRRSEPGRAGSGRCRAAKPASSPLPAARPGVAAASPPWCGAGQTGSGRRPYTPPAAGRRRLEEHRICPHDPGRVLHAHRPRRWGTQLRLLDPGAQRASPTLVVT